MRGTTVSFFILLYCLYVGMASAYAQAPLRERQFVYGANAYGPGRYDGVFFPLAVDTMYLLADEVNIVSARYTLVYFWPITNEYRTDWDALNQDVPGMLEVLRDGRLVQALERTTYVIQYPRGQDGGQVRLYVGAEAEKRYAAFEAARQAFREAVWEHARLQSEYTVALERVIVRRARGERAPLPKPPRLPEPFRLYSTAVHQGFPIRLPPGHYDLQLRLPDGQILPQSRRRLVVFAARRAGIGYTVVPQARWTTPERSDAPGQAVYARPGVALYLQPFLAQEYNELYWTRRGNPQSLVGSEDRWIWISAGGISARELEIRSPSGLHRSVTRRPYRVRQLAGSGLGYEVVEHRPAGPGERPRDPDFEGYELRSDPGAGTLIVRLLGADGAPLPGSERTVRTVRSDNAWRLWLVPLAPWLAAVIGLWRRRRGDRANRAADKGLINT
ncbi:MAG: hypothetical protein ACT4P5_22870 [Armatimonadota bacterium]